MPRVLHVGPCNARGGMATVMRTLAEHPPVGWSAELLPTYSAGGIWAKWRAYRRARRHLKDRCSSPQCPDVVHVHVASDWSWRRKSRLIKCAREFGPKIVIHVHSGAFLDWVVRRKRQLNRFRTLARANDVTCVVLSQAWKEAFKHHDLMTEDVVNPCPPNAHLSTVMRRPHQLLLMGRPDPVKGHQFAERLYLHLQNEVPDVGLWLTGVNRSSVVGIEALGWVSEHEKQRLLESASVLLIPSAYEGQPMVMLEALATGLPVVASTTLKSPPNGVTVAKHADVTDWSRCVRLLFEQPPEPATLRASVREHHITHVQQQWLDIYTR